MEGRRESMENLNTSQTDEVRQLDGLREKVDREELVRRIAEAVPEDGDMEPLRGLRLTRLSRTTEPVHGVAIPSFCVIAQGTKEIHLSEERYRYDPYHYLLATVELPILIQQVVGSPEQPYLSLRLELDAALVASVMLEAGLPSSRGAGNARAIDVSPLDGNLLEAAVRLVRLVDAPPAEARVMLPLVKREIIFRLLMGEQSARLRQIAVLGGHTERIVHAIDRLRTDFDKPIRMENLAREIGMSPSGFHEHFKAVTAMSPLQFQKQLRLQEARRLLLSGDVDAASAGFQVGYEDAAQFSKEYKRFFGEPPMRDRERLRDVAGAGTVA